MVREREGVVAGQCVVLAGLWLQLCPTETLLRELAPSVTPASRRGGASPAAPTVH